MRPMIEIFEPRELGPKDWGTELLVAHTPQYIGKVLWMRAGTSGPFQHHVYKDETFYLFSGEAVVRWRDAENVFCEQAMVQGESYRVPPGAAHQVSAISNCVFFEASTPHFDDRVAEE